MDKSHVDYRLTRTIEKYRRFLAKGVHFSWAQFVHDVQQFLTPENVPLGMSQLQGEFKNVFAEWVDQLPEEPRNLEGLSRHFSPYFGGRDARRITAELKKWFAENNPQGKVAAPQ
jgi:hypothetical protein